MRRFVPFVGEKQISRADGDQERAKRAAGRVIDEVVSTQAGESTWDDVVPADWPAQAKPRAATVSTPSAASTLASGPKVPFVRGGIPSARTAYLAAHKSSASHGGKKSSLEWVLINNGHGLRINIHGNIDHELRLEWQRLLEETLSTRVDEYEFNLSHTPALSLIGLGMLLLFKEHRGTQHEVIRLYNCSREVAQLLNWTGMDKYFVIQSLAPMDV